jgi:hypothetical protein
MPIQVHFYALSRTITAEGMSPSPISSDSRYILCLSYVLFSAALHPSIWISPSCFRAPQTNISGSSTSTRRLAGPRRRNLTHKRQCHCLWRLFWTRIPVKKMPRLRSVRIVELISALLILHRIEQHRARDHKDPASSVHTANWFAMSPWVQIL